MLLARPGSILISFAVNYFKFSPRQSNWVCFGGVLQCGYELLLFMVSMVSIESECYDFKL